MIKFIPLRELQVSRKVDLVSQAMLHRPVEFFEKRYSIVFEGDSFEKVAIFETGDGLMFGLVHYSNEPKSTVKLALYIEVANWPDEDHIEETILKIVRELGLEESDLLWKFQTKVIAE